MLIKQSALCISIWFIRAERGLFDEYANQGTPKTTQVVPGGTGLGGWNDPADDHLDRGWEIHGFVGSGV